MKVLLTGAAGQLGQALISSRPEGVELITTSRSGGDGLIALDLADSQACRAAVEQFRPDWVLNGGAYTAVDKAESEPELALAVNGAAPQAFAEALADTGGALLQLSTDFVFNGQQGSPYLPEQRRDPLGVYGASKAVGEEAPHLAHFVGSGRALRCILAHHIGAEGRMPHKRRQIRHRAPQFESMPSRKTPSDMPSTWVRFRMMRSRSPGRQGAMVKPQLPITAVVTPSCGEGEHHGSQVTCAS